MDPKKRKALEAAGWRFGDYADFLGLTEAEQQEVELRGALCTTIRRRREALGITQDSVSRLEQRSDLLLSTLRNYVEALGGSLSLIAEFPDHDPVVLSGIANDDMEPVKPKSRKRTKVPT